MVGEKSHGTSHIIEHIVLAVALVWAAGCTFVWSQTDMPHRIVNAKSPDGTCEVTISELGSPVFFSPNDIRIKVLWDTDPNVIGAENVTQIETILSNDGKSLDADNFTVTWRDNIPTVITHGEEQHDQSYTFNWKDVPHRFG